MKRAKAEVLNTVQVSCGFPQNFEHDSGSRVSGDQQLPLRHAGIPTSWKFLVSTPKLAYSVRCTRFPTGPPCFARVSPSDLGGSNPTGFACFARVSLQRHPKFLDWTPKLGAQGFPTGFPCFARVSFTAFQATSGELETAGIEPATFPPGCSLASQKVVPRKFLAGQK